MDKAAFTSPIRIEWPQSVASRLPHALLPLGLIVAAFIVDVRTASGLLDGLLYVFPILACQRVPKVNWSLYAACIVMLPMILGFVLSPTGVPTWVPATHRLVVVVVIWVTALVVWRSARTIRNNELTLEEINKRMHAAERLAHDLRCGLSDWLREDIDLELQMIDWRLNRFSRCPQRGADVQTEALVLRRAVQRTRHSVTGRELRLRSAP